MSNEKLKINEKSIRTELIAYEEKPFDCSTGRSVPLRPGIRKRDAS